MQDGPPTVPPLLHPLPVFKEGTTTSGSSTAKTALAMLVQGDSAFIAPTKNQRRNLAMAFAAENKVVYGRAFDAVKIVGGSDVDLDDLDSVRANAL
jgi:hypothetical protein